MERATPGGLSPPVAAPAARSDCRTGRRGAPARCRIAAPHARSDNRPPCTGLSALECGQPLPGRGDRRLSRRAPCHPVEKQCHAGMSHLDETRQEPDAALVGGERARPAHTSQQPNRRPAAEIEARARTDDAGDECREGARWAPAHQPTAPPTVAPTQPRSPRTSPPCKVPSWKAGWWIRLPGHSTVIGLLRPRRVLGSCSSSDWR